jgi:hypothetical protein
MGRIADGPDCSERTARGWFAAVAETSDASGRPAYSPFPGQAMIGTEEMLFLGLPSITRSV